MRRLLLALFCVLIAGSSARAQGADGDPDRIPGFDGTSSGILPAPGGAPINVVEGPGVKIGEGTVLYPTVGADTGFISNVFYEETDTSAAGIFRLIAQIGSGSLNEKRLAPPSGGPTNPGTFSHREELRLTYDFYLSGNDYVSSQNGLGINGTVRGTVFPQQNVSFLYLDNFERVIRSTNFESSDRLSRDINRLSLGVQYAPPGRTIRGILRYDNTLDLFENDADSFADRMHNSIGLGIAWRFRPVTVFGFQATQGFNFGLGDASVYANAKADSYPLTLVGTVQTLLSLKTSIIARLGYTNGFYSAGPSYSTVTGGIEGGWRYSPLGRVTLSYDYAHEDSINANYYRDHRIALGLTHQFVPFVASLTPEIRFREYDGVMTLIPMAPSNTRTDFIAAIAATLRYNFRDQYAAVAEYRFSTVQTDFRYTIDGETDDPTYLRHELFVGFRAGL